MNGLRKTTPKNLINWCQMLTYEKTKETINYKFKFNSTWQQFCYALCSISNNLTIFNYKSWENLQNKRLCCINSYTWRKPIKGLGSSALLALVLNRRFGVTVLKQKSSAIFSFLYITSIGIIDTVKFQ